jgi:hypothetical protein
MRSDVLQPWRRRRQKTGNLLLCQVRQKRNQDCQIVNLRIINHHLEHFTALWYIFWSFGIFFSFWYVVPRKSGNPG